MPRAAHSRPRYRITSRLGRRLFLPAAAGDIRRDALTPIGFSREIDDSLQDSSPTNAR